MRILIDIGHPAHVHYFRNFIKIMEQKGHFIAIIARDKEVTHKLLNAYKIPFINRGGGGKGVIGKIIYLPIGNSRLLSAAAKFKPDIFLSFASPYAAQVSKILRKPHISFDDTEHAKLSHLMYMPFTDVILTPNAFLKDIGPKQVRFNGFIELSYLHPDYYSPDTEIFSQIGVKPGEPYSIVRFVSWEASHDFGKTGLTQEFKIKLINTLEKYGKVFISAEGKIPSEFERLRLKTEPEKLHDILTNASLYIGEGATTASECAMIGTPAIYVNVLDAGTIQKQEEYNLLFSFRDEKGVIEKAEELLKNSSLKLIWKEKKDRMLSECIDVTKFMIWFVSNYPDSFNIMRSTPDYQLRFKNDFTHVTG